jgi:hypothetical protein
MCTHGMHKHVDELFSLEMAPRGLHERDQTYTLSLAKLGISCDKRLVGGRVVVTVEPGH